MPESGIQILNSHKPRVWNEVKKYLVDPKYPARFDISSEYKPEHNFYWKVVSEYPERQGKYLRPTLVTLTSQALGASSSEALKTATAMQISEEWLLIHDDLEDGSKQRRGKPTLHLAYGLEQAVNAGDALQVIMWRVLLDNLPIIGPEKTDQITNEFYKILMRTTLGQAIEIRWMQENKLDFSDSDWFFICDGKTSYYTIAGPMRLGAIIANASDEQIEKITDFGLYLGRCFQLVDDLLDITSDFGGLKKQKGNDIYEGKRTIMLGHLLRNVAAGERREIARIFSKSRKQKTQKEVDWVIKKMNQLGSIEYGRSLASELKQKAIGIFENDLKFLSQQPERTKLETLIHFVLERDH